MDIAPQGDTSTIGLFPHCRQDILILCLLLSIVGLVNIQLGDEHGHQQRILLFLQCIFQIVFADVSNIVRLVTVGINRCSCITQSSYQGDVVIDIPLDRVVVVIDENSIRPALISHLEGLDEPVVTSLTTTS